LLRAAFGPAQRVAASPKFGANGYELPTGLLIQSPCDGFALARPAVAPAAWPEAPFPRRVKCSTKYASHRSLRPRF
jgi:hypothetical protein